MLPKEEQRQLTSFTKFAMTSSGGKLDCSEAVSTFLGGNATDSGKLDLITKNDVGTQDISMCFFYWRTNNSCLFYQVQAWASSLRSEYHSCDWFAKFNNSALKCRETDISVFYILA